MPNGYDPHCRRCPRLAGFLDEVKAAHPDYHCRPVAAFGATSPRIFIVGLAPGMHGANRSGRPFTGDFAGILLYATLHRFSLANRPVSAAADDGLRLRGVRITNAVKCLPPQNKPNPGEIASCNAYLRAELEAAPSVRVILALGVIAHAAVIRATGLRAPDVPFRHGAEHAIPGGRTLLDSYHCSRYNTQTRRLTPVMFDEIVRRASALAARERGR